MAAVAEVPGERQHIAVRIGRGAAVEGEHARSFAGIRAAGARNRRQIDRRHGRRHGHRRGHRITTASSIVDGQLRRVVASGRVAVIRRGTGSGRTVAKLPGVRQRVLIRIRRRRGVEGNPRPRLAAIGAANRGVRGAVRLRDRNRRHRACGAAAVVVRGHSDAIAAGRTKRVRRGRTGAAAAIAEVPGVADRVAVGIGAGRAERNRYTVDACVQDRRSRPSAGGWAW